MKRFLFNTLIVCAVLLVVMSFFDWNITRKLRLSDADFFKGMNDVYFDSTYYDVVVMGSSRGLVHYDPFVIDSVLKTNSYNASIDGRGIISQIIKYKLFEKKHGKPHVIIQNVDCFLLAKDNGYEREQYLPFLYDRELFEMVRDREDFSRAERIIPLIRYSGYEQIIKEGLGLPNDLLRSPSYKGFRPSKIPWNGKQLANIGEIGFPKEMESVVALQSFLEYCQNESIKVVFVYAPFYYGAQLKFNSRDLDDMFATFECIGKEYNIPVLSWWDSPICKDTMYFYNAAHLNEIGARVFTHELAHCIDSLGIMRYE